MNETITGVGLPIIKKDSVVMMENKKDIKEIRELFEKMATAWANGDGEAYGSCFTKNADYITFQGEHVQGRRTIVETHNKLWHGVLKGSVLVGEITKLEFLSGEVVVFHGIGAVKLRWQKRLLDIEIQSIRMLL